MRAGKRLIRLFGIYAFALVIGVLGGRIVSAAQVYAELGWTAMWAEISSWGPDLTPAPARTSSAKSARI
jgi:hypothetical protein